MNRRTALRLALAPAILRGRFPLFAQSTKEYSARAIRLMEETTVVDLLDQFRFADFADKPPKSELWMNKPGSFTAADAAVYQGSGIRVFALGHSAPDYQEGLKFYARWNGFIAAYSDWLTRIDNPADFERVRRERKIGIMLTMQDSTHFRTPADVDEFFALGQRLSQLTYNFNNRIGSGFLEQRDGGLSVFGLSILKRMEKVGMAVDVSHCADQTTLDALEAATRPVVFTHANCRALIPGSMRAKTDEAIRRMAKTGGVMGISFIRFMVRDQEPVGMANVLDHFDYVRKLVGVEYLAVGSDLDVIGNGNPVNGNTGFRPESQPNFDRYHYHVDKEDHVATSGLDHPKRMFDLTEGLIARGYSDADIKLILGGNAARVLSKIWSMNDARAD
ncbi:MAG: dipeptidase [Acidobacteriia bacterium]|nr:dipeptidase [Terriglobia bacterium]